MALTKQEALGYAREFQEDLDRVIRFWVKNSPDWENGGYLVCLDTLGKVYDTLKPVWLQGRQTWMFSEFFTKIERKPEWLRICELGANFLRDHCRAPDGSWYFSVNRRGKPLVQPYNIFSDCFATMALSGYAVAAGQKWARQMAAETYANIIRRSSNPKGQWSKAVPGGMPSRALALPMIEVNLAMVLSEHLAAAPMEGDAELAARHGLSPERIRGRIVSLLENLFKDFVDPATGLMHEHIMENPEDQDSYGGRLVNPGHTLECCWFVIEAAKTLPDEPYKALKEQVIAKSCELMLKTLDFGWDKTFGGIFYFMDMKGAPVEQLEWDQKLWWVHVEAMIACAIAFRETRRPVFGEWYRRLHEYSFNHFVDKINGEWFGYLNRRGEVLLALKGGKWKGCFHVPRGDMRLIRVMNEIATMLPN